MSAKTWIAGVKTGGTSKAYWFEGMPTHQWIPDQIGNQAVKFRFDPESTLFEVVDGEGNLLPVVQAYWFAWQAFHPKTEIWSNPIR